MNCAPRARRTIPKTGTMSDFFTILVWVEIPNHISVSSNLERLLPVEAISQDTKLVFISGLVGRMPRGASSTQL